MHNYFFKKSLITNQRATNIDNNEKIIVKIGNLKFKNLSNSNPPKNPRRIIAII